MEYLDIITPEGNLTGQIRERGEVHREGEWHRTSHVWIARKCPGGSCTDGRKDLAGRNYPHCQEGTSSAGMPESFLEERLSGVEILLQKRSLGKDSFPGCYDISSAGHIPAGQDFEVSAIRELKEELGIEAHPEELIYCGLRRIEWGGEFYGEPFIDRQLSRIYLLWRNDLDITSLRLQKEEVEEVRWIGLKEAMCAVEQNSIPHCIYMEELEMVKRGVIMICSCSLTNG